jgi:hypothetical protein
MNYEKIPLMDFKFFNSKLKPLNNSCESIFVVQFHYYASSPIHLKDNTQQNKDKNNINNEHK